MATAVTVALGAGLVTAVAPAATAAPAAPATNPRANAAGEAVLPPQDRRTPRRVAVHEAGPTGYLATVEGNSTRVWTDFATGETRPVANDHQPGHSGLRSRTSVGDDGTRTVTITDLATDRNTAYRLPREAIYAEAYTRDAIVVYRKSAEGAITSLSILRRAADGTTTETPVTGVPDNSTSLLVFPREQQDFAAVIRARRGNIGVVSSWYLDYATAKLTEVPVGWSLHQPGQHRVIISFDPLENRVTTFDLRKPDAAPVVTDIPAPQGLEQRSGAVALVGDTILVSREINPYAKAPVLGGKLFAVPIGNTGETRELLPYATHQLVTAPDGSVLVTGGSSPRDWAVRRVTAEADGSPKMTTAHQIPAMPVPIDGLALGGGRLSYVAQPEGGQWRTLHSHDVTGSGTPVIGPRDKGYESNSPATGELHSLGDGRSAFVNGAGVLVPNPDGSLNSVDAPRPATLDEASGRYLILSGSADWQYIGDVRQHWGTNVPISRIKTAASVWGTTLWTPGKTAGSVVALDLKTRKSQPELKLGSGCVPNDLQAVGRWLYWACGTTKAGVYDRTAAKSLPVAAGGRAKLGDGFVVRESSGELALTNLHTGTTTPVATIPANAKWAVDKFGGHLAYTDAEQAIRVRAVDVPRGPIALAESEIDSAFTPAASSDDRTWNGHWQLSRPAGTWSVTVKNAAGAVVRTLAQGSVPQTGARLAAVWDGKSAAGRTLPNGKYGVTLTVDGRPLVSNWTTLYGSHDAPRDYNADGVPEVVTRLGADLTTHQGLVKTATGGTVQRVSKGWKNITAVLPMGDMNHQGWDDLVVRNTKGELWRHEGTGTGLPGPTSARVRIGGGFAAFDTILPAGDLTGDGRGDLLARKPDGKLFVYAVTATGALRSAGTVSGSFKGLTLIAPGDLTGDRHGDLLARDAGGELWRYNGTGKGTLGAKTLVQKDWAVTGKVFAGIGDLNGDGNADLVSRDTTGRLWQHLGTGKGTLSAATQVGTGWQRYTSLH
ncbi:FG-GAP-like repeat-containing protein [Streptomyces qinzhouensis]|uniref:FG-GAP-like repeat-containing protein n=1 Tax=Streptomyces qinzhouensis TaxID=2599401 RepID=UPI001FE62C51|nr:FlgD immunoglobulin-like domain containing protein [Streptomyces qinzhouensis]